MFILAGTLNYILHIGSHGLKIESVIKKSWPYLAGKNGELKISGKPTWLCMKEQVDPLGTAGAVKSTGKNRI